MLKRKVAGRTYFLRLPRLANLELLHASNITHVYPPHIHEQQCIVLMLHGSETTTLRGSTYTSLPGDIFALEPEALHSSRSIEAEYKVFKIRPSEFTRIAAEVLGRNSNRPCFTDFAMKDTQTYRTLLDLHRKLAENDSLLQQESEFLAAIGMLIARHDQTYTVLQKSAKEDRCVDMVRDYLKSYYSENVSLSYLTSLTNVNRFHLLRAFQSKFGIPPHEFQTQVRIAHARELIRRGYSFSDVAIQTGFFDQSHLHRHFRRIVGLTPGEYLSGCNNVQDHAV